MKRVGVYAGTFDPVHAGHVAFALQAAAAAKLDRVYFLPERRPRHKQGVEHFGHRVAMLKRAARPHAKLGVIELEDVDFSVERTLPRLQARFRGAQLVFLAGSDVATRLPDWPKSESLLKQCELVIGIRSKDKHAGVIQQIKSWPLQPKGLKVIESYAAEVSSAGIREALRQRRPARGLLESVARYANRHWLYVSLAS